MVSTTHRIPNQRQRAGGKSPASPHGDLPRFDETPCSPPAKDVFDREATQARDYGDDV